LKTRVVLLGAPGSGKGTHAELLTERLGLPTLSTGAQLRREMAAGTELGKRAHELTKDGNFVPDEVVLELAGNWLREHPEGFVLDGFPRTLNQARQLDALLKELGLPLQAAVALEVAVEVLEDRILKRIICTRCQHTEQVEHAPAGQPDVLPPCEKCGGIMQRRADDSLETLYKRLAEYESKTQPLLPYYEAQGLLTRVNAARSVDIVFSDVQNALQ
jgi:adenylate kinase